MNSRLGRISLLKFQCARVEVKILSDSTVFYFLDLKYVVYLKDYRGQIFSKHGILTKKDIKSSFVEFLCEVLKIGLTLPCCIPSLKPSSIWKEILLWRIVLSWQTKIKSKNLEKITSENIPRVK